MFVACLPIVVSHSHKNLNAMKNLLVLLLAGFFSTSTAQTQQWFADDHRWVFNLSGGFAGVDLDFELKMVADTVVQGKNCKKWGIFPTQPIFHQFRIRVRRRAARVLFRY